MCIYEFKLTVIEDNIKELNPVPKHRVKSNWSVLNGQRRQGLNRITEENTLGAGSFLISIG